MRSAERDVAKCSFASVIHPTLFYWPSLLSSFLSCLPFVEVISISSYVGSCETYKRANHSTDGNYFSFTLIIECGIDSIVLEKKFFLLNEYFFAIPLFFRLYHFLLAFLRFFNLLRLIIVPSQLRAWDTSTTA